MRFRQYFVSMMLQEFIVMHPRQSWGISQYIKETAHGVEQEVMNFKEQELEILYFADKVQFHAYADSYAKEYIDIYGNLCEIKIIVLDKEYGILVEAHHIVSDAWTLSLIASQFYSIVHDEMPEAYSYIDYINKEKSYTQSQRFVKDRKFFPDQFKTCDELTYLSNKVPNINRAARKTFIVPLREG